MNNIFRIKTKIYREIARLFCYRPASYPYISGDGFRKIADHIYDETSKCKPEKISFGDTVFVKTDIINEWFQNVHPNITSPYKLITHNSDNVIGERESRYIDNKIIHWFAQNNIFKHEKITPIPIGIENRKWFLSGWVLCKIIKKLKSSERKRRILFGFNAKTNTIERTEALNILRNSPITDEIKGRLTPLEYFKLLNQYVFVASPEGNGPDCHRTWEALYIGVIPIVKVSVFNNYFKEVGVPLNIISSWSDIKIDDTIRPALDTSALYFDFWKEKIINL
jgi:hypothetical protein